MRMYRKTKANLGRTKIPKELITRQSSYQPKNLKYCPFPDNDDDEGCEHNLHVAAERREPLQSGYGSSSPPSQQAKAKMIV